jgi:hypothetical protein
MKAVILLVAAVLLLSPIVADRAEAFDPCGYVAGSAPVEYQGPLMALCFALLLDMPDPFEDPDDFTRSLR